ncbi:MAG: hypothetical protein AAFQ98_02805 [Bacteroidota bacterium]
MTTLPSNGVVADTTAQEWMQNWSLFAELSQPDYFSLFTQQSGQEGCIGLNMEFEQYVSAISPVGSKQLCIRMGCATPKGGQFGLILYPVNNNQQRSGNYYLITQSMYRPIDTLPTRGIIHVTPGNRLPDQLGELWRLDWNDALFTHTLTPACFTLPVSQKLIRGYNYQLQEIIDTLFPPADHPSGVVSHVYFILARHGHDPFGTESSSGCFGLVLLSGSQPPDELFNPEISDSRESGFRGSFYDLGSPCPDTCPPFDGGL